MSKTLNNSVFVKNNNGQIIAGNFGTSKKYDEKKNIEANSIDQITVESSFVNVNFITSNTNKIIVHLFGEVYINGDLKLEVKRYEKELYVSIKLNGNNYSGDIKLDILVPTKRFTKIKTKTLSANVNIGNEISAIQIELKSESGDIKSFGSFQDTIFETMSGDLKIRMLATSKITIEGSTMSSDVDIRLMNAIITNPLLKSISGSVRNQNYNKKGHTADLKIDTMSGNIWIK